MKEGGAYLLVWRGASGERGGAEGSGEGGRWMYAGDSNVHFDLVLLLQAGSSHLSNPTSLKFFTANLYVFLLLLLL